MIFYLTTHKNDTNLKKKRKKLCIFVRIWSDHFVLLAQPSVRLLLSFSIDLSFGQFIHTWFSIKLPDESLKLKQIQLLQ